MTRSFKTHRLVESALMIALAVILSFIIIFRLPFGGSITLCSMLPLILISYRYGVKWGVVTCFAFSLIQVVQGVAEGTFSAAAMGIENGIYSGGFFVGSQVFAVFGIILLDYVVAYTVLGLAGIFRDKFQEKPAIGIVVSTFCVGILRYFAHVFSGAIFFGIWGEWFFTQEGFFAWGLQLVQAFPGKSLYFIYSFIYNGFFIIPEIAITAVAGLLIVKAVPKLAAAQKEGRISVASGSETAKPSIAENHSK